MPMYPICCLPAIYPIEKFTAEYNLLFTPYHSNICYIQFSITHFSAEYDSTLKLLHTYMCNVCRSSGLVYICIYTIDECEEDPGNQQPNMNKESTMLYPEHNEGNPITHE